jgi:2-oxoisovalerate dehydrogenase E1 component
VIRDLGAALAMRPGPEAVRLALSAQMGKAGPPMAGKDLHFGDFDGGVLPASAPLSISTVTVAGLAMAFARQGGGRVAVSFIGEGGSSLGEWHEAVNLCAAHRLPAVFCLQNNQTALSTSVSEQSRVRVFADKARGYGIPGITLDGTDPEAIAAAFAWAAERARGGEGPTLIELVAMRMCGHAHHDDMLYLGKEQTPSWDYPRLSEEGYADRDAFARWAGRDPIVTYAARLVADGVIGPNDLATFQAEADELVAAEATEVVDAAWPPAEQAGAGVLAGEAPRSHVEPLEDRSHAVAAELPPVEPAPAFDPKGSTFLEAVMRGVGDALRADPRVLVYGQDVGGRYGNAFLLLRPLLREFGDRILNSPLCEGGVIGACVGSALGGLRPIGEIQFNDFVATGFNQLVNNAAKIRYRWGADVPMVLRLPWGGLRRAGPYHSQNTEPWFYRTPGLKIVAPSTPWDARALLASAMADPDPVLYYEHIALYRDPKIKQRLGDGPSEPLPLGRAALRRAGSDLVIVSYGAYVHLALRLAERLAEDGIQAAVLDLRSLDRRRPRRPGSLLAAARGRDASRRGPDRTRSAAAARLLGHPAATLLDESDLGVHGSVRTGEMPPERFGRGLHVRLETRDRERRGSEDGQPQRACRRLHRGALRVRRRVAEGTLPVGEHGPPLQVHVLGGDPDKRLVGQAAPHFHGPVELRRIVEPDGEMEKQREEVAEVDRVRDARQRPVLQHAPQQLLRRGAHLRRVDAERAVQLARRGQLRDLRRRPAGEPPAHVGGDPFDLAGKLARRRNDRDRGRPERAYAEATGESPLQGKRDGRRLAAVAHGCFSPSSEVPSSRGQQAFRSSIAARSRLKGWTIPCSAWTVRGLASAILNMTTPRATVFSSPRMR